MDLASQKFICLLIISNLLGDKYPGFNTLAIKFLLVFDLDDVGAEDAVVRSVNWDANFPVEWYRAVFGSFFVRVFDSSVQLFL